MTKREAEKLRRKRISRSLRRFHAERRATRKKSAASGRKAGRQLDALYQEIKRQAPSSALEVRKPHRKQLSPGVYETKSQAKKRRKKEAPQKARAAKKKAKQLAQLRRRLKIQKGRTSKKAREKRARRNVGGVWPGDLVLVDTNVPVTPRSAALQLRGEASRRPISLTSSLPFFAIEPVRLSSAAEVEALTSEFRAAGNEHDKAGKFDKKMSRGQWFMNGIYVALDLYADKRGREDYFMLRTPFDEEVEGYAEPEMVDE